MSAPTLEEWLERIETLNTKPIDLGLDRMREMIRRMGIRLEMPVITVAGTNGKGSTCTLLERIYSEAGLRTGLHTSPHLLRFNERARICEKEASDVALCAAFEEVEAARGDMPLTYFEFTALGILRLFERSNLDVVILEIGLGGRLDAINTIDPSASIVTTVGLDHTAWLGDTREAIGFEKAHVFRTGRPALCADPEPPASVEEYARAIGADYRAAGVDWEVREAADGTFDFKDAKLDWKGLPRPALAGENQYRNAGGVLAMVSAMMDKLPVERAVVERALETVRLTARFETVSETPCTTVLDVGHNPQAAEALAVNLAKSRRAGETTLAVFGMLRDKDMRSVSELLKGAFDEWFVASLTGPRAATADELSQSMIEAGVEEERITRFDDPASALAAARSKALQIAARSSEAPVRIIVFGSFVTVSSVLAVLASEGVRR